MEELGFWETTKFLIDKQPALTGVTLALFVAMAGKFNKSIFDLFAGLILIVALGFQVKAALKEILSNFENNLYKDCIEKKIEALNDKTININELYIDSCEKLKRIKSTK